MAYSNPFFAVPRKEVRSIQAKLYEELMEEKLTVETMEKYKQYLDKDIVIVSCRECVGDLLNFENDPRGERPRLTYHDVERIRSGDCCNCDCCLRFEYPEAAKLLGIKLIHRIVNNDRNLSLLTFLIKCHCDLNSDTLLLKNTPLMIAITENQSKMVQCLVDNGANLNEVYATAWGDDVFTTNPTAPLHLAIQRDLEDIVTILLGAPEIDVDIQVDSGHPLLLECVRNHKEYVERLLQAGANPDCGKCGKQTPLWYCASRGKLKLVDLLILHGANFEGQIKDFMTKGDVDAAAVLLEAGAKSAYCVKKPGDYLMVLAAMKGYTKIVKLLIKYGGNVNPSSKRNHPPLHLAARHGCLETIKVLLEAGALHDFAASDDTTPLTFATEAGHIEVMKLFLTLGCNVNKLDSNGNTPLHYAAYCGHSEGVKLLLQNDANPDISDVGNTSALWLAIFKTHKDITRQLLIANAKMEISSRGRKPTPLSRSPIYDTPKSPLYVALDKQSSDITMMLIEAGYNVHKESWLMEEDIPHKEDNANLIAILQERLQTPVRLLQICRTVARHCLGHTVGEKVEKLELPQKLKDCLILKYFAEDMYLPY